MRAPSPLAKKSGCPPTAWKARTGEFTPPGMIWRALSKSVSEIVMGSRGPDAARVGPRRPPPAGGSAGQKPGRVLGVIGQDEVGPGAADRHQRLEHDPV